MRIVTVLNSLGMGGAEKLALAVGERLAARGHTVAVLVLRPPLKEQWPTSIPVVHLGVRKTPAAVLAGLSRARRFLRGFRPDVAHSHSFHSNIFARGLRLLAGVPAVISNIHNVNEGGTARMLAYRLTDGLSRRTVAVSEAARQRFVALKAVSSRRSAVLPLGIDTGVFSSSTKRRVQMRAAMEVAPAAKQEFVWLAVGRITPAKDYPNLLAAFAGLSKLRGHARLWVAGEEWSAKTGELRALSAELGVSESVRWLGLRRDLPALLDAADGFVLGSAWEGMPQAIAEAMAMEVPVVATDVGGVRELMNDTGFLVPAKDPASLAHAMLKAMDQGREESAQNARAARARVVKQFSIEAAANAWESLYSQLAAN
jgi:glycosyltransferase involved in cell wall biosynthesis